MFGNVVNGWTGCVIEKHEMHRQLLAVYVLLEDGSLLVHWKQMSVWENEVLTVLNLHYPQTKWKNWVSTSHSIIVAYQKYVQLI